MSITGTWKWDTITYSFFDDGTYSYYNSDSGMQTNGKYIVSGDILNFITKDTASKIFDKTLNTMVMAPLRPDGSYGTKLPFERI